MLQSCVAAFAEKEVLIGAIPPPLVLKISMLGSSDASCAKLI
jgi:hypothetical protein